MAITLAEVKDVERSEVLPPDEFFVCKASEFGFDMHTPSGKTVEFRGFQHVTSDAEVAAYLQKCIEQRVPGLLSLKRVTKEELDPLHEMRQKHIAEYLAQQDKQMREGLQADGITKQAGMAVSTDIANKGASETAIAASKALSAGKVNS